MPYDALRRQVEHLAQGIVIGKGRLVFGNLAELAIQALDDIGGINNLPDLWRIVEEGTRDFPVFLPAFDAGGILPTPEFSRTPAAPISFAQRSATAISVLPIPLPRQDARTASPRILTSGER